MSKIEQIKVIRQFCFEKFGNNGGLLEAKHLIESVERRLIESQQESVRSVYIGCFNSNAELNSTITFPDGRAMMFIRRLDDKLAGGYYAGESCNWFVLKEV